MGEDGDHKFGEDLGRADWRQFARGIFSEDPLQNFEPGQSIVLAPVEFTGSDGQASPGYVKNPGEFKGALLSVAFVNGRKLAIMGTAFIVTPGLAISASHIYRDKEKDLAVGDTGLLAFGLDGDVVTIWRITRINFSEDDDIALLSLSATSGLPKDGVYSQFPLTTGLPRPGSIVDIFGFRIDRTTLESNPTIFGNLIAAKGIVGQIFLEGRDSVMLPFPVIEINAGSIGAMSGGVAITSDGHVFGVISSGFETSGNDGPTYVSWVVKCLSRRTIIDWPRGLHKEEVSLIEIDPKVLFLEGREHLMQILPYGQKVTIWYK